MKNQITLATAKYHVKSDTFFGCVEKDGATFSYQERNADELIEAMKKEFPTISIDYDNSSRKFSINYQS